MSCEKNSSAKVIRHILLNEIQMPEVIDGMAMLQMDATNVDLGQCCSSAINAIASNSEEKSQVSGSTRVLRKRTPQKCLSTDVKETLNKRKSLRPRKRSYAEVESDKEIKNYYLDKSIKKPPNSLETIFEEESSDENSLRIGKRKLRRLIEFGGAGKIKKRHAKMKAQGKSSFKTKVKISMETVINKLNSSHKDHSHSDDNIS